MSFYKAGIIVNGMWYIYDVDVQMKLIGGEL